MRTPPPSINVTSRRATLRDIDVSWSERGAGPPVVLIHGLAEDRRSWDAQLSGLSGARVAAYDLRGHGETTLGDADGTLAQLGRDLAAFLDAVTGPAICVGFSLGGTVVLWAAANHPELVTRAVPVATSSVVGGRAAGFYAERIDLVRHGAGETLARALREDTAAAIAGDGADIDVLVARRLAAIGDGAGYANAAAAMAGLHEALLTPLLAEVSCPVTVIGGERDAFCPRKAADILLAAMPQATYREIAGAGHLLNVDDPAALTTLIQEQLG